VKAGWKEVPLGEIAELINGRAYKKTELLDAGPYPVLRVGNFFTNRNWYYSDLELPAKNYCDKGDLLYAWSASFGPRIWSGDRCIFHYHIWKVVPDLERVSKAFLFHLLDWDKELIKEEQGAGATMLHVSKRSMEARLVPLPPLEEQQRIVAILDEAFAGLDRAKVNAEANLASAKELFLAALGEALNPQDAVKAGWRSKALGTISEVKYGFTAKASVDPIGPRFLRITDIQDGDVDWDQVPYCRLSEKERARHTLRAGDIVFARTGATTGKSFLIREAPEAVCASYLIKVRPDKSVVHPGFLNVYFQTRAYWETIALGTEGAAQGGFNASKLAALPIPLPPLEEQQRIVERLDRLKEFTSELESRYAEAISDLDQLRQSLLAKAFAGELT